MLVLSRMMSRKEVAGLCRVTCRTVIRWERQGLLRAVRVGGSVRYRGDQVRELILELRTKKK